METPTSSGRTSSRRACESVQAIHAETEMTVRPSLNPTPVKDGTPANCWAMPVTNGLVGPNPEPTTAAPTLMARAVIAPKPSPLSSSSPCGRARRTTTLGRDGELRDALFSRPPPAKHQDKPCSRGIGDIGPSGWASSVSTGTPPRYCASHASGSISTPIGFAAKASPRMKAWASSAVAQQST